VVPGLDEEVAFVMEAAAPPDEHLLTVDGATFALYRWQLWRDDSQDLVVDPGEALIGSSAVTILAYAVEGAIPEPLADAGLVAGWNVVTMADESPESSVPLVLGEQAFTMEANLAPVVRPSLPCLAMDPLVAKVVGLQSPGQTLEPLLYPSHVANLADEVPFELPGFERRGNISASPTSNVDTRNISPAPSASLPVTMGVWIQTKPSLLKNSWTANANVLRTRVAAPITLVRGRRWACSRRNSMLWRFGCMG